MTNTLQVLMPMGGLGRRFKDVGIDTPKPLIDVDGVPMFERALRSFDGYPGAVELIVVVRADDDAEFGLSQRILAAHPGTRIVSIARDTGGAVETCLEAAHLLDPTRPLVVLDCDIAFRSDEYFEQIQGAAESGTAGVLLAFSSRDPRYSFARVDENGWVVETAEKRAISSDALMGAYFFTTAQHFITAGEELVTRQLGSDLREYYVSLLYNSLIARGQRVGLARGEFYCFGTPEELERYLATRLPT